MRRSAVPALAALTLVLLPATAALAAPSPGVGPANPGKTVCSITESALSNITGLVATSTGYAVSISSSQQVYLLDSHCKRKSSLQYSSKAISPQDISAGGGAFWIADTGDSAGNRDRIAMWKLPSGGGKGTIYRFTYPGGAKLDSLAMVRGGNGLPVFVTKSGSGGPAGLYAPSAALNASGTPVPLKKVGTFTPVDTGTATNLGKIGRQIVTGGATSPDGKKVALRTYSDAYVWNVTNGDVAAAIAGGKPLITPLPSEAAGEAISFSSDGQALLTTSKGTIDGQHPDAILRYTPTAAAAVTPTKAAAGNSGGTSSGRPWYKKPSLEQITYLVAALGVIGLLMVVGGIFGIRRARANQRAARETAKALSLGNRADPWDNSAGAEPAPVSARAGDGRYDPYAEDRYPAASDYRSGSGRGDDYDRRGGAYQGGAYQGGSYQGGSYQGGGPRPDGPPPGGPRSRGQQGGAYQGGTYQGDGGGRAQPGYPSGPPPQTRGAAPRRPGPGPDTPPPARPGPPPPGRRGYADEYNGRDDSYNR